jgi:hypothetical protein
LTRTEHVVLKTQLIAGAATLTIFSGAACAANGIRKTSRANASFFTMMFPEDYQRAIELDRATCKPTARPCQQLHPV